MWWQADLFGVCHNVCLTGMHRKKLFYYLSGRYVSFTQLDDASKESVLRSIGVCMQRKGKCLCHSQMMQVKNVYCEAYESVCRGKANSMSFTDDASKESVLWSIGFLYAVERQISMSLTDDASKEAVQWSIGACMQWKSKCLCHPQMMQAKNLYSEV